MPEPCYAVRHVAVFYPDLPRAEIERRLHYSTYVSLQRRYLYFEVPKAGCTSMKTLLHSVESLPPIVPAESGLSETRRDMFIHDRSLFQMPSLVDFDDATQEHILNDSGFFRFTVVRNPYTRLESAWKDKVLGCMPGYEWVHLALRGRLPQPRDPDITVTLGEFIRLIAASDLRVADHHWRLQSAHLFLPALNFSFVGRLERFADTVSTFLAHAGITNHVAPESRNQTSALASMNDQTAWHIYNLFRADFAAFRYDRNSWRMPPTGPQALGPQATGPQPTGPQPTGQRMVPEGRLIEEMRERNIVLGGLYDARTRRTLLLPEDDARILDGYRDLPFTEVFRRLIEPVEGWLEQAEAQMLYDLAASVVSGCIIEIGSYRGRSAVALALGSNAGARVQVFAVDPHTPFTGVNGGTFGPVDAGHFMRTMLDLRLFHYVSQLNTSSEYLGTRWPLPVSLLWIDGDHRTEAVHRDFRHWQPHLAENAIIVLDDATTPDAGPGHLVRELTTSGQAERIGAVGKVVSLRWCG